MRPPLRIGFDPRPRHHRSGGEGEEVATVRSTGIDVGCTGCWGLETVLSGQA